MVNCRKFSPEIRSETKMPTITTSVLYSVRGLCKKAMKKNPVIKQTNEQIYNYKNYFSLQSSNMSPSTSLNCSSFTVINLINFWFPGFFYSPFANTSFFFSYLYNSTVYRRLFSQKCLTKDWNELLIVNLFINIFGCLVLVLLSKQINIELD